MGQKREHASPARTVTDEQWAEAMEAIEEMCRGVGEPGVEVGAAAVVKGHVLHAARITVVAGSRAETMEATELGAAITRAAMRTDPTDMVRQLVPLVLPAEAPPSAKRRGALF